MNAKLFFFLFFITSISVKAQWIASGNNVYTNGRVGIGTSPSSANLRVSGTTETDELTLNKAMGRHMFSSTYQFTYNGITVPSYSFCWSDKDIYASSGYTLWVSSNYGMKFFTGKAPRLTIDPYGKVGIGTVSPTQNLTVVGKISAYNSGVTPEETYQGQLILTKPYAGGQFINLVSAARIPWSIGVMYNQSAFAIGEGKTSDSQFTNPYFTIARGGNVGIGVLNNTSYKLDVNGTIRAREIRVSTDGADFVFEDDYELPSLDEVHNHIKEKKHLPGIASAKKMQENGVGLSELNTKLLQKIEELTLYVIEQNKTIKEQGEAIEELRKELNK